MSDAVPFSAWALAMGVLGGLALFLYGMEELTRSLKLAAGARLKRLLARLTTNRFRAAFAGAFVTAVIQSSSVTTVLVVGFVCIAYRCASVRPRADLSIFGDEGPNHITRGVWAKRPGT